MRTVSLEICTSPMNGTHTVEKIGGTSMTRFHEVMKNVVIGNRSPDKYYNRIFVVSAYGGITNLLLDNKKTGEPGVFACFANGHDDWQHKLDGCRERMRELNRSFEDIGLDIEKADAFVDERIDGVRDCLKDLMRVRAFGHMTEQNYLPASREMLSAIGEAHSAHNSSLILNENGVNACFVDLSRWKNTEILTLDEAVQEGMKGVDIRTTLPIVTGFVKCDIGIMSHFSRGYSEITFSKIAVLTGAKEGIIHKEYHLCTGDPVLIGPDKVKVIGQTNFDIADQMSDLNMEAIHAKASMEMAAKNVAIRVKNAFDPEHPGTVITSKYVSSDPKVEMICGREDIVAVTVYDSQMVGQSGYDYGLLAAFADLGISYIAKSTNANTISHYVSEETAQADALVSAITERFPTAQVHFEDVAIVSVLGSNMSAPTFFGTAAGALANANVQVLGMSQSMRGVNMQLMVARKDSETAQMALHKAFVETS
jgi:aspartate kinase